LHRDIATDSPHNPKGQLNEVHIAICEQGIRLGVKSRCFAELPHGSSQVVGAGVIAKDISLVLALGKV
jgi:hypothetical protein